MDRNHLERHTRCVSLAQLETARNPSQTLHPVTRNLMFLKFFIDAFWHFWLNVMIIFAVGLRHGFTKAEIPHFSGREIAEKSGRTLVDPC
jgi:hypothetical protein